MLRQPWNFFGIFEIVGILWDLRIFLGFVWFFEIFWDFCDFLRFLCDFLGLSGKYAGFFSSNLPIMTRICHNMRNRDVLGFFFFMPSLISSLFFSKSSFWPKLFALYGFSWIPKTKRYKEEKLTHSSQFEAVPSSLLYIAPRTNIDHL